MKTQEQLIEYYERRLKKVKIMHPIKETNTDLQNEKAETYIDNAYEQLKAVKNGRNY